MLLDNLAYRTAQSHIRDFAGESDALMLRHVEAMECRECESYLQLGIDAFSWLKRADSEVRKLLSEGKAAPDSDVDSAFELLYRLWLRPCEQASKWVETQLARGYEIDNLGQFRAYQSEARRIVENSDRMKEIAKRISPASDLATIAVKDPRDAWRDGDRCTSQ